MAALTVDELMNWYLDGLDAGARLSSKTRVDTHSQIRSTSRVDWD